MIDEEYLKFPARFHLEWPLYEEIKIDDAEISKKIFDLVMFDGKVDAYCIWCKKERIFSVSPNMQERHATWHAYDRLNRIELTCSGDDDHEYYAYYYKRDGIFQKIGQFPSVADFQIPQAEKYRSILGDDQYRELTKGIGLFAHGVGIGSFVYLRRIFENLIEKEHLKVKDSQDFSEEDYQKSRMDEKIVILKNYLPKFLVENKNLYSILSIGIHELTEKECLKFFVSVRIGIEQILDDKITEKEKADKEQLARKAVQAVSQELSEREKLKQQDK